MYISRVAAPASTDVLASRWWRSRTRCWCPPSTRKAATMWVERRWRLTGGHDRATASSPPWLASVLCDAVHANMGSGRGVHALGRGRLWGLDDWPASRGRIGRMFLRARRGYFECAREHGIS
jgi:hypothetical protein